MRNVCVLLADGFEEIEAVTLIDVLRRAKVAVAVLGVTGREVKGAHGIEVVADGQLSDRSSEPWDMVILPGGARGAAILRDDPRVQSFLRAHVAAGGKVAAICAAPIALGKAGILEGKRATCYPGFEGELAGATVVDEAVVQDGAVFTSRGPGTALTFALELVAELVGREGADGLRRSMLVTAAPAL